MRDLLIFGIGKFAEVAAYYFETEGGFRVTAFVVDDAYFSNHTFYGRPVLRASELPGHEFCRGFFFAAVGASQNNSAREEKLNYLCSLGLTPASFVSKFAYIGANVVLGKHCFILENNVIQPFVVIGDNVVLWSGNHIGHHSSVGNHCFVSSHCVISGSVEVQNNAFLGVNSTILPGVIVGASCFISAGALVTNSLEPNCAFLAQQPHKSVTGGARWVI